MSHTYYVPAIDPEPLNSRYLVDGQLVAHPYCEYATVPQQVLAAWGRLRGYYCLPTTELVDWLRQRIAGRPAIEIGAGHGALGRALGIPATDSFQQKLDPETIAILRESKQPVVLYGSNVELLPAPQAIRKYRPTVVVAAWVTHRWHPKRHHIGGNALGVDEAAILRSLPKGGIQAW